VSTPLKPKGKALLVGNGINLAAGLTPSWADVVKDLFGKPRSEPLEPRMKATPFPLLIEEACVPPFAHKGERVAQRTLVERLDEWRPAPIHRDLLGLGARHVLTTNYDLTLERASGRPYSQATPFIAETRYSLFRRNVLSDGASVWHIHGSVEAPRTMVLGYEHYSGHLQAVREAVVNGRSYGTTKYGPLKKSIPRGAKTPPQSWVEVALTHHLLIAGLRLDFAETALWWLLTYRARRRNLDARHLPATEIVFAVCRSEDGRPEVLDARAAQLRNCGVEVFSPLGGWDDFYPQVWKRFATMPSA
jgi:hypothetical protein